VAIGLSWLLNGRRVAIFDYTDDEDEDFPKVLLSNQSLQIIVTRASAASSISHNVQTKLQSDLTFLQGKTVLCRVFSETSPSLYIRPIGKIIKHGVGKK